MNEQISEKVIEKKHFVGIDISMDSFYAAVMDEKGKVFWNESFKMDEEGFKSFYEKIQKHPNRLAGMESTSTYHINLLLFLVEQQESVVLLNPMLVKRYVTSQTLRKCKTDKADARMIASYVRNKEESLMKYVLAPSQHLFRLARCKENVSKQISSYKTKLKQMIRTTFPELIKKKYAIYTDSMLNLLLLFPSASSFCNAGEKKVEKYIQKFSKGKGKNVSYTGDILCNLAKHSIGRTDPSIEFVIKQTIETLCFFQNKKKELIKRLKKEVGKFSMEEVDILSSIPGVGKDSAVHFMAEINNIGKFPNYKALTAYIGTDPGIEQSGQSFHRKKISKRGNSSLRRLGFIMAQKVIQYCPRFKEYYLKKRKEGMAYRKAVIAVWNKLLRTLFSMLQNHTYFLISDS